MLWGTETRLRELLGHGIESLDVYERVFTFRYPSARAFVDFFRTWYGPTAKAFAVLDDEGRAALEADLVALADSHNRLADGPIAIPSAYLEAVAIRS
jgi:hypothetical protein